MDKKLYLETQSVLMLFMALSLLMSCQQGKKINSTSKEEAFQTVKGEVVFGHKVESFTPDGSIENYWIDDPSGQLKKAYDSLHVNAKFPYIPIYAELKVKNKGKASEGFAADYAGVYELIGIVAVRNLNDNETSLTCEQLISDDGTKIDLLYNTAGETPIVFINYGKYVNQELTQTEAWAKGAEYANDKMKWQTTPDGGILEVDGKKLHFKNKK